MIEVLHGHHTGEIRKHQDAIIRAGFRRGIAQRGHLVRIVEKFIKTFHTAAGCGFGRRLRDGIHAYVVALAEMVAKATGEIFKRKKQNAIC